MTHNPDRTRRSLTQLAGATGLVVASGLWTPAVARDDMAKSVTPPEDLMREHGVLDRVLLIYEAAIGRFAAQEDFDPAVITRSAQVVRDFIEDYHEKSEEEQVFYRFTKANQMVDLVATLLVQHTVGRRVTDTILHLAPSARANGDDRRKLIAEMQAFIRMYRPHAAREDTDLFPKLRTLVSANEYDSIGEQFERDERTRFGDDGFEKMVDRVAQIERMIGIDDLAKVTPT
jgi:hemerythrin-like domain-containing protein